MTNVSKEEDPMGVAATVGLPGEGQPHTLTDREVATILAALRIFQRIQDAGGQLPLWDHRKYPASRTIGDMEHFEEVSPLTEAEIETLCERINLDVVIL